jgi:peptide/nickel transport system substrate-binding protein
VSTGQGDQLGLNLSYYDNKDYADLLAKARVTIPQDDRATLYKQAQKIIADEAPWLFMFHAHNVVAANKKVQNIVLNPDFNILHLERVWLQP